MLTLYLKFIDDDGDLTSARTLCERINKQNSPATNRYLIIVEVRKNGFYWSPFFSSRSNNLSSSFVVDDDDGTANGRGVELLGSDLLNAFVIYDLIS